MQQYCTRAGESRFSTVVSPNWSQVFHSLWRITPLDRSDLRRQVVRVLLRVEIRAHFDPVSYGPGSAESSLGALVPHSKTTGSPASVGLDESPFSDFFLELA